MLLIVYGFDDKPTCARVSVRTWEVDAVNDDDFVCIQLLQLGFLLLAAAGNKNGGHDDRRCEQNTVQVFHFTQHNWIGLARQQLSSIEAVGLGIHHLWQTRRQLITAIDGDINLRGH